MVTGNIGRFMDISPKTLGIKKINKKNKIKINKNNKNKIKIIK